jgi:hypothetical protein
MMNHLEALYGIEISEETVALVDEKTTVEAMNHFEALYGIELNKADLGVVADKLNQPKKSKIEISDKGEIVVNGKAIKLHQAKRTVRLDVITKDGLVGVEYVEMDLVI